MLASPRITDRLVSRGFFASAFALSATVLAFGGALANTHAETLPSVPEEGLIARYDFDEGDGTVLHDHSGHGFDGVLHGGTVWKAGAHGSSLEFNGVNAYVQLPSDSAFNTADFTVAAWIQPYEIGQGTDERVIYSNLVYEGNPVTEGTEFKFHKGELDGVTARVVFDGDYWFDMYRPAALADGAWHMVAFTEGQGYGRLWIDGVQAGAAEPSGAIRYPTPLPRSAPAFATRLPPVGSTAASTR